VRPTSFRFAGGLYSSSVALHKFGQRWYDQSLDRWTQQDPIDQTGDLKEGNRYLYVGDNPINGTDPSGACIVLDCSTWDDAGDVVKEAGAGAASGAIGGFIAGLPEGGVGAIPGAILGAGEGAAVGAAGGIAKKAGVPSNVVDTASIFYGSGRIVHDFTKSVGKAINNLP
jgi:RHS repeat-associated protein